MLNVCFNALSIQQECHRTLQVCAVGFNVIDLQPIQHDFSRMSKRVLISRGDHRKLWMDLCQQS